MLDTLKAYCSFILVNLICFQAAAQDELIENCTASRILHSFKDLDLSPHLSTTRVQTHVLLETHANLFRLDRDSEAYEELATNVQIDKERNTLSLEINPTCRWSDGEPITAHDMLVGIQRLFETTVQTPYLTYFKNAEKIANGELPMSALGVRVINNRTLEMDMIWNERSIKSFLSNSPITPVPTHITNSDPNAWPGDDMLRISSGPYVAVSHSDTLIELEPNPYYCEGFEGNAHKINLHGVKDRDLISRLMQAGIVNIGEQITKADLEELKLDPEFDRKWKIIETKPYVMSMLTFHPDRIFGQNPELIDAALLAIDFDTLEKVIGGDGVFGRRMMNYNFEFSGYSEVPVRADLLDDYDFRLTRAKEIMEANGYSSENPLKIYFGVRHSSPYQQLGYAIRSMLNAAYFNIEAETVQNSGKRVNENDLSLNAWGLGPFEPMATLLGYAFYDRILMRNELGAELQQLDQFSMDIGVHYATLHNFEKRVADERIHFPIYEVLSPSVISTSMKLGREKYELGRNMIIDGCN